MRDFTEARGSVWIGGLLAEGGLALLCGLILTFLSPFDTARAPLGSRLIYWVGLSLVWLILSSLIGPGLARLRRLRRQPRWRRIAVAQLVRAVPMTAVAAAATHDLTSEALSVEDVLLLYAQVILVCAGADYLAGKLGAYLPQLTRADPVTDGSTINGDNSFTHAGPLPSADGDARGDSGGSRLLQRLAPAQRGRIRCLSVEDHYVRVHTDRGAPLVLMRFADALAELDGVPGERVHRSWWVSRAEPWTFRRDGRRATLELVDDLTVPVSTPYLETARALAIGQS